MKILITTDTYLPMINGVVTSIVNLHKQLKILGHDVRILTLSNNGYDYVDGDVYYLKSLKSHIYPDARVRNLFNGKLIDEIIKWRPDIIHSQTEFSTMIDAKRIASKLEIPQVHTYHTMYEDYLGYFLGGKIIKKSTAAKLTSLLLNTFDEVIAPTKKVEYALLSYGVKSDIAIVPTGIDISKFNKTITYQERTEIRQKYGFSNEDKILLYLGRIAKEKNIEEIIDLFKIVNSKNSMYKLLIVGGGPYLSKLKSRVKSLGLDKCVGFPGMINTDDVYMYYKISDAFVTASTSETQGLTYIEALASGCPVICKWDKCIEGLIINNNTGFIYKTTEEFIEAAKKIQDVEYSSGLKMNCLNKAKEYSSEGFASKIERIYYHRLTCNKPKDIAI